MIFLGLTSKAKAIQAKIDNWNYLKLKSFSTAKETNNKIKRQPMEWEKIFANHLTDKELISQTCKEPILIRKKKKNLIENWAEVINRHFSKDFQMVNRYLKMFPTSLNYQGNASQSHNDVSPHVC